MRGAALRVLQDVNEVDHDVDFHAAPGGLRTDRPDLRIRPVYEHDPGAQVTGVTGFGLVEHPGDDVGGGVCDGGGQPLADGLPGYRLSVVDRADAGHAFAVRTLAVGQPGGSGGALGLPSGFLTQAVLAHHDPGAVHRQHQQRRRPAGHRRDVVVEGVEVGRGTDRHVAHGLRRGHRSPTGPGQSFGGVGERAAGTLGGGELARLVGVQAGRQVQLGVEPVQVFGTQRAEGRAVHGHVPDGAGQTAGTSRFHAAVADPGGVDRGPDRPGGVG